MQVFKFEVEVISDNSSMQDMARAYLANCLIIGQERIIGVGMRHASSVSLQIPLVEIRIASPVAISEVK